MDRIAVLLSLMAPEARYELGVWATIGLMVVVTLAIAGSLRWALRGWKSIRAKSFLVNLPTLVVLLFWMPRWKWAAPVTGYAGLTVGVVLSFWAVFVAGDILRSSLWLRYPDPKHLRAWLGFSVTVVLACVIARSLAQSEVAITQLRTVHYYALAVFGMNATPSGRVLMPAMESAFPDDLTTIIKRQAEQIGSHRGGVRFPMTYFQRVFLQNRDALSRAPDAELGEFVHAMAEASHFVSEDVCATAVTAPDTPTSVAHETAMAELLAAAIRAERAGIDHPTARQLSPDRTSVLLRQFGESIPEKLRSAAVHQDTASLLERCEIGGYTMAWLGARDPTDAIYFIPLLYPKTEAASSGNAAGNP